MADEINIDAGNFFRSIELESSYKDDDIDTIIASSEARIPETYGWQILEYKKESCDLDYIKRVGSFLFNHDPNRIIGPLKNFYLNEVSGTLEIDVGYDMTEEGILRKTQIRNKSLRGISLKGRIRVNRLLERGEKYQLAKEIIEYDPNRPTFIAIDWFPYEISALPTPADKSAGFINRGLNNLEGIKIIKNKEFKKMNEQEIKEILDKTEILINRRLDEALPKVINTIDSRLVIMSEKNEPVKLAMTTEIMRDLCNRASAISDKAMNEITIMALEGKGELEILRHINTLLSQRTDAKDGGSGNDFDKDGKKISSAFKNINDNDFYRSILSPTLIS